MRIDLHCHTACSDGTDTPSAMLALASAAGLDVVAITDHDTTSGWAEAEHNIPDGLTLIRGAEFSTRVIRSDGRPKSIHLLGYLFDPADPAIVAEQDRLLTNRETRGLGIVGRLVAAGLPITADQVLAIAAGAPVGRPHIGRALIESGAVDSMKSAFEEYLDRPEFEVIKANADLDVAIVAIKAAGGVAVLAHPWSRGAREVMTAERLAALAEAGLDGIEVDHPDHDPEARTALAGIAAESGLIATGSSDYHGGNKTLRIGQELSSPESLAQIIAASSGVGPLSGSRIGAPAISRRSPL